MLNLKRNLFVISFLLFSLNVFSQSNSPTIGYDKVAWGASIQTVTQAYPTIKEQKSPDASIGIRQFQQINVGNGIESRIFFFYNNKLYQVAVFYEEQRDSKNAFLALLSKLIDIYGTFDKDDKYNKTLGNETLKFTDLIFYYNKDLTIVLRAIETYDRNNIRIESSITCIYTNPNTNNDIEIVKSKQKEKSFGL